MRAAVAGDPGAIGFLPRRWVDASVRTISVEDLPDRRLESAHSGLERCRAAGTPREIGCCAFRKACGRMAVKVILRKEEFEVPAPISVGDALRRLNLPPDSYLVIREGVLLDEHEILQDGETIRLVGVISGG